MAYWVAYSVAVSKCYVFGVPNGTPPYEGGTRMKKVKLFTLILILLGFFIGSCGGGGGSPSPDFKIALLQKDITIVRGSQAYLSLQAEPLFGFSGEVNLSLDGVPPGVVLITSKIFLPDPSKLLGGVYLYVIAIFADPNTQPGFYQATLKATSGNITHRVSFNLNVQASGSGGGSGGGSQTATLTVIKAGTGSGAVVSNPPGINCGNTCSAQFNTNTSVVLIATPDSGSTFAGWAGDCLYCGTNSQCTVNMTSSKTCSASFNTSTSSGSFNLMANPTSVTLLKVLGIYTPANVTVSLQCSQGFNNPVNLSYQVKDPTGLLTSDITVSFVQTTLNCGQSTTATIQPSGLQLLLTGYTVEIIGQDANNANNQSKVSVSVIIIGL